MQRQITTACLIALLAIAPVCGLRAEVQSIAAISMTVSDIDRSVDFYTRVMGMQELGSNLNTGLTQERLDNAFNAKVRLTALRPASSDGPGIEFLQYLTPPGGRPIPPGLASNDLTHVHIELVVQDVQSEVAKLEQAKAQFVSPEVGDRSEG